MQAAELIKLMITEGNGILLEFNNMRKTIGAAINVNYYVDEDVEKCRKQINKWQMTSKDILISKFGETHRYVSSFEKTMSNKDKGFDYKKEYYFEVNQGLSVLESISETLKLGLNTSVAMENMERNKTPKVFISHKGGCCTICDLGEIVSWLVQIYVISGCPHSIVAYSSGHL